MDISSVKVDPVKIEQGAWVGEKHNSPIPEMGDLCLQVRGAGNADWRKLQAKLLHAVPRNKRLGGRVDPDEMDKITSKLLLETGLTGWENIVDAGVAVPFSKEKAAEYIMEPKYRAFRDACMWACSTVGEETTEQVKADAKNFAKS